MLPFSSTCSFVHDADFMQGFLRENEKKLARSLNLTFRYTAVLLLNKSLVFVILLIVSIPLSLKLRIPQIQLGLVNDRNLSCHHPNCNKKTVLTIANLLISTKHDMPRH